jgi:hypothetical protein
MLTLTVSVISRYTKIDSTEIRLKTQEHILTASKSIGKSVATPEIQKLQNEQWSDREIIQNQLLISLKKSFDLPDTILGIIYGFSMCYLAMSSNQPLLQTGSSTDSLFDIIDRTP